MLNSSPRPLVTLWTALALQVCLRSQRCIRVAFCGSRWRHLIPPWRLNAGGQASMGFHPGAEPAELFSSWQTGRAADLSAFAACWAFGGWRLGDKLENLSVPPYYLSFSTQLSGYRPSHWSRLLNSILGSSPAFLSVPFAFLTSLCLKPEEMGPHAVAPVGPAPAPGVLGGRAGSEHNAGAKMPPDSGTS